MERVFDSGDVVLQCESLQMWCRVALVQCSYFLDATVKQHSAKASFTALCHSLFLGQSMKCLDRSTLP